MTPAHLANSLPGRPVAAAAPSSVRPEDYDLWKANFGSTTMLAADGNGDHIIDAADYTVWRNNLGATLGFGSGAVDPLLRVPASAAPDPAPGRTVCRVPAPAVPEPATLMMSVVATLVIFSRQRAKVL